MLFVIINVPDQYKSQQMCEKVVFKILGMRQLFPNCYKTQKMCIKTVDHHPDALEYVPDCCIWNILYMKCTKKLLILIILH